MHRYGKPNGAKFKKQNCPHILLIFLLFKKFVFNFFLQNTSEQHTATDLVNLLYFLRQVSSDHTDFIREFEQDT